MQSDSRLLEQPKAGRRATRTFVARLAVVPRITSFVEAFCVAHDAGGDDALRLALVVEELVANTIAHGHRGECDAPIVVSLRASSAGVELRYEDTAPCFDLVAALAEVRETANSADEPQQVGGRGLHLIAHYGEDVRHTCENGRNRVSLKLRRRS